MGVKRLSEVTGEDSGNLVTQVFRMDDTQRKVARGIVGRIRNRIGKGWVGLCGTY